MTHLRLCWLWSRSVAATVALKLDGSLHFDPLRIFAGEVGIAVAGAKFDRMATGENDVMDFAHLCVEVVVNFY